jgi:hypothetical protein
MPPGGGHDHHGRSRTPHAECRAAGIFSAVSPALRAPGSGAWSHHAASPPPGGPGAGAGDPAARKPDPAAIPHRQLFRTPFCIPADTGTPGPGECAGSARNKPSRELPDLYTCTARKTIVTDARQMMTYIYFPVVPSAYMYMSALQPSPSLPGPSPRVPARSCGQAGGPREAAGGAEKGAGKRRPGGPGKARWRTVSVATAVRDELREPARKLARKFPDSRRNGVDSCQKGELASLLYPEIPGEIPRQIRIPGNGEKRAHANAGPYSASPLRR